MIIVIEQDARPHNGKRFTWIPFRFRGWWNGRRTWRVAWGLWSVSCYPSPGLKEFFDYVESGATEWDADERGTDAEAD